MKTATLTEIGKAFDIVLDRCREKGHYTGHHMVIYAYPKGKVKWETDRYGYVLTRQNAEYNYIDTHESIGGFMKVYDLMMAIGYADSTRVFSRVSHSVDFVQGNWSFNVFVKVR